MTLSDDFYGSKPRLSHPSERPAWVRRQHVPSNNWAVWLMAFLPLAALAANVGIAAALGGRTTWVIVGMVIIGCCVVAVSLARADRRELDAWGFENTASPWLVLLTPAAYLGVRGNRVWQRTAAGFGPFWMSIAVLVSVPIALRLLEVWLFMQSLSLG